MGPKYGFTGDTCIYGDGVKITFGNYATGDFF